MPKEHAKLTLDDIAVQAGVSASTVSRVINNSGAVKKELAARVRQAMAELGFDPGAKPRTKPYIIAWLTYESGQPTAAAVIKGAQEEADRLGICLVILNMKDDLGYQPQNFDVFKYLAFDALVIDHARLDPEQLVRDYHLEDLPVVVITPFLDSPRFYCITSDRENGMYQAVKYLVNLNHKEIAYISWAPDLEISQSRLRGIHRALDEAGLHLRDEYCRQGASEIDDGFEAATSILRRSGDQQPTAIIAYNDLVAIGAMHAIRAYGLTVPDDISVIGFNEMYFTPHTNPPLTTVSQPSYREGELAIQKLYNRLQGADPNPGGYTLLECRLVVRESTGPCPAVP